MLRLHTTPHFHEQQQKVIINNNQMKKKKKKIKETKSWQIFCHLKMIYSFIWIEIMTFSHSFVWLLVVCSTNKFTVINSEEKNKLRRNLFSMFNPKTDSVEKKCVCVYGGRNYKLYPKYVWADWLTVITYTTIRWR